MQLFKTARWSPLFMRVPEGYSLKSITLAREIKTALRNGRQDDETGALKSITLAREIKTGEVKKFN